MSTSLRACIEEIDACTVSTRRARNTTQAHVQRFPKEREVVLHAVRKWGWALFYADDAFLADREVVLAAVRVNGEILYIAAEELHRDREVVLTAASNHGSALLVADDDLFMDAEVVYAAFASDAPWDALNNAHPEFLRNRTHVLQAVLRGAHPAIFEYTRHGSDPALVLEAARRTRVDNFLEYVDGAFRADRQVVRAVVAAHPRNFRYAEASLRRDHAFVLELVAQDGHVLAHVGALAANEEVVLAAVQQNGNALRHALWFAPAFVAAAVASRRRAALCVPRAARWERAGPKQVAFLLRRVALPWDVVEAHVLPHFAQLDACD